MKQGKKLMLWLSITLCAVLVLSFLAYKGFSNRAQSAALSSTNGDEGSFNEKDGILSNPGDEDWSGINKDLSNNNQLGGDDFESISGVTDEKPFERKLVEDGSTNILILGEDKENALYDTIGIVSVSQQSKTVKIIMIPRDMYVKYNKKVLRVLEKDGKIDEPGIFKINYAHHIGVMMKYDGRFKPFTSINFLSDVIKEKFGVEVDDFVKINTEGFAEIVDLFGGVDIYVPYRMDYYDPTQQLRIDLEEGLQHLDGKQAEGFVRFRMGFKEDGSILEIGDDGRKVNQINFLKAFFEQHGTIKNIDKVPGLVKKLDKNLKHSIGFEEILFKYMGIARNVISKDYKIESETLTETSEKWINGSRYVIIGEE